jgi:c-di-GMP-binding flagellar brake protein YcgR
MMSDAFTEQREHPRTPVSMPIRLFSDQDGREIAAAQTIDLSNGGALVQMPHEELVAVGEMLRVELVAPVSGDAGEGAVRHVWCRARVVRHHPGGEPAVTAVAVEFQQLLDLGLDA